MNTTPWFDLALKEIGVAEFPGPSENPRISQYWQEAHISDSDDITEKTPWCSVFACAMMESAGIRSPRSAWARDWLRWGTVLHSPVRGCKVVLDRGNGFGHVGDFVQKMGDRIQLVGGNQHDSVNETWFPESKVLGYRMPALKKETTQSDEPTEGETGAETPITFPRVTARGPTHSEEIDRLREAGSRTVASADAAESRAKQLVAWTIAGGLASAADKIAATFESLKPIAALVSNISPAAWGVVVCLALLIAHDQGLIRFARADDSIEGKNNSR